MLLVKKVHLIRLASLTWASNLQAASKLWIEDYKSALAVWASCKSFKAVFTRTIFLDDFLHMHLHIIGSMDKGRKGVHALTCSVVFLRTDTSQIVLYIVNLWDTGIKFMEWILRSVFD